MQSINSSNPFQHLDRISSLSYFPTLSISTLLVVLHRIYSLDTSPVWLFASGLFLGIRCLSRSMVTRPELHDQGGSTHVYIEPTCRNPGTSKSSIYLGIIRTTLMALAATCSSSSHLLWILQGPFQYSVAVDSGKDVQVYYCLSTIPCRMYAYSSYSFPFNTS